MLCSSQRRISYNFARKMHTLRRPLSVYASVQTVETKRKNLIIIFECMPPDAIISLLHQHEKIIFFENFIRAFMCWLTAAYTQRERSRKENNLAFFVCRCFMALCKIYFFNV